jgi:hypothetical protein
LGGNASAVNNTSPNHQMSNEPSTLNFLAERSAALKRMCEPATLIRVSSGNVNAKMLLIFGTTVIKTTETDLHN